MFHGDQVGIVQGDQKGIVLGAVVYGTEVVSSFRAVQEICCDRSTCAGALMPTGPSLSSITHDFTHKCLGLMAEDELRCLQA